MPAIEDFIGHWTLERHADDLRLGVVWAFRGHAAFRPAGAGVLCEESGWISTSGHPPLHAERRYLWRAEGGLIDVRFGDGRPFHRFDPRHAAPEAAHICGADLYRVRYELGGWPLWRTIWCVGGPCKDLRIASRFTPACAAPEGGAEPNRISAE